MGMFQTHLVKSLESLESDFRPETAKMSNVKNISFEGL